MIDDPYYFYPKIPIGIYQGRLINTTVKKAITILDDTKYESHYKTRNDYSLVANVYHNAEFYIALIPQNKISRIYFLSEPFGIVLAHSMMRFNFSSPVKLIAKIPSVNEFKQDIAGEELKHPIELNDLILSIEATSPHGITEFAAIASFFYTRGLAMRIMSLTGRGVDKYLSGESQVKQYRLNLSSEQANQLFDSALKTSHQFGMKKMYQTLIANCNWFAFNIIENSKYDVSKTRNIVKYLGAKINLLLSRLIFFGRIYPPMAKFALSWRRWRHVDSDEEVNLEQDIEFLRLAKLFQQINRTSTKF